MIEVNSEEAAESYVDGESSTVDSRRTHSRQYHYASAVLETAGVALIATDLDGFVTSWNRAAEDLYGFKADELIGRHVSLVAPPGKKHLISATIASVVRGDARRNIESVQVRADGSRIDVALDFAVIRDTQGRAVGISAAARDITEEKRAEKNVRRERDLLRKLVVIQQELAAASDQPLDEVMQLVAERAQDLTGAEGAGIQVRDGYEMVLRAACGTLAFFVGARTPVDGSLVGECIRDEAVRHCRDSRRSSRVHRQSLERSGARSLMLVPLHGRDGIAGVLTIASSTPGGIDESAADILQIVAGFFAGALDRAARAETERALRAELAALAVTDGLTGLKNHRSFQERLAQEVARSHRNGTTASIIMLDVDRFKEYNDSFGHPAGDRVLKQVAAILQRNARQTDLVARYGGEEFVLILPHTDLDGAVVLAERIRVEIAALDWPLRNVTASFGVAQIAPLDSPASFLSRADDRLYRAKSAGRNIVEA